MAPQLPCLAASRCLVDSASGRLASNAFWWLPGLWLLSTKGASDFAFAHSSEVVLARLLQIVTVEAEVQVFLIGLGLPGLVLLIRQSRIRGAALPDSAVAGFFWGYLAGGFQVLDFLQPGRHTYALLHRAGTGKRSGCGRILAEAPGRWPGQQFDSTAGRWLSRS